MEILNYDKFTKFTKLIIIGMPGAGKTTIMNKLIKKGYCSIDIDRLIEPNRITFSQLAKTNEFKDKEHDAFKLGCLSSVFNIISTGGSVPCDVRNRLLLKDEKNLVIWLDLDSDILEKRMGGIAGALERGVCFNNKTETIKEIYKKRYKYYKKCADVKITNIELKNTMKIINRLLVFMN
tara:strand:- start:939 stop:1475 length:537 start_codon:yes stop_codon:yes gene_type:complete